MANDVYYFRLRIPRKLGDKLADDAWKTKTTLNAKVIDILCEKYDYELPRSSRAARKTQKRAGASEAGTYRISPPVNGELDPNIQAAIEQAVAEQLQAAFTNSNKRNA